MMKTIPFREFKKMRQALRDYFNHIKKHSNSLIIRFYGLHEVKWTDLKGKVQVRYLCIMGNIFQNFQVGLMYDLKGSTAGRTYLKPDQKPESVKEKKTAMKDNDFVKYVKQIEFAGSSQADENVVQVLLKDADFLAMAGIIDYSILLGEIEGDWGQIREVVE